MSRFTAINLSGLTPPDVIETLDYEAIVTEMCDDLVARFPAIAGVIDLESEPARKLIEAFAYREMLLRARINDAARSVLLASAYGSNLDHLAALFGTQRMQVEDDTGVLVLEDDDRLRRRVQLAPEAFSVAGPEGAYVYHALTAAPWARDATAIMTTPGRVRVTILRAGPDPVPSLTERETIRLSLIDNDVRPLTDMVEVLGPRVHRISVEAKLTLYPGPDGNVVRDRALSALSDWVETNRMLGMNLRRSAIFSKLHVEGVHSVDLVTPAADIVLGPTEVYAVEAITVTIAALRDE
ncbi:baseplate assembly protein [Antarctobacter heliothermus]|uniref:Phage-related baseplate assembly protein n=1 Tax=Antarctobacter heliothermus TaxID=74033 RepID=A0A239GWA9_9RHOB|nr:baseplate J/gp47 family protein [Antarctobacter heliothermus]SNS73145.1 Phage-related baseplate assembly protein [Antarctobacter heliothermus]